MKYSKMSETGRQRESNMELLRIVSILMIVVFHCAYKSGFDFEQGFGANKLIVKNFWMLGELGVDLFMLISGYYMVDGRFKWKKLVRLLVEVQFYNWTTAWAGWRLGIYTLSGWKNIFFMFFPVTLNKYWFITAYILVYILSPYLNILIKAMDRETYQRFLVTVLILQSVLPTVFGIFFNTTENLLYYNRFIWLIIMYFLGAYIRDHGNPSRQEKKLAAWAVFAAVTVIEGSILVIDRYSIFFAVLGTTEPAYFWPPNTVPMVFLSVGIFRSVCYLKIPYDPAVNAIASTTLGIYLLHDGILASWLWRVFRCAGYQGSPFLLFRILGTAGVIFVVGVVVDLCRQAVEHVTIDKLLDFGIDHRAGTRRP